MARGKQTKPKTKAKPAKAQAKPKKAQAQAKPKAKAKPKARAKDSAVDAVSELVSVLACPKAAINELALSCENVLDQIDVSCGFARFTATVWSLRPAPFGELDEVSRALVEEYERHATAIGHLLDRLAPLAEEDEHVDHEDLDPMDVFERVRPMLAQSDDASQ